MPELPEVERGRRLADRVAAGRTITRVRCADDRIVFDGVSPATVRRTLVGRTVVAACRHGKQLWFELDRAPHPLFHFGMTGAFRSPDEAPLKLASSRRVQDPGWPPRFAKIHLRFDDGGELVMTNARRLGRIRLRESPREEPPIADLGFDPLLALPSSRAFGALLTARSAPVKAVLLDQSFAAGVGNWIADEVLYQSGLDPRRRSNTLSVEEVRALRRALKRVVEGAVRVNGEKARFPKQWLFHRRWGKAADATTVKGERIAFVEVGGRTTAWVPEVQR
ncbi:MAG: hypothetical protein KDA25_07040 [Phycisphaerales bacterium]|nr:hypothetical protein [Phycisphaerales bacterium]